MKKLILSILFLMVATLAACSPTFPLIQDTRPATATPAATPTAEVILVPTPEATAICLIKGNINDKGEKIYFVPGQANYVRTIVDPKLGEKYFCTEDEARSAGWRRAIR